MATTPSYGWVTPSPTDFVTDLPADFETFADAVDADLAGLLGGTTGQVLTKDSNDDHDFSWQSAAAPGGDNWTLLNAGGTALTASQTITVSGISGQNKLMIIWRGASSATAQSEFRIRFNADSGANYASFGSKNANDAENQLTNNHIRVAQLTTNAASTSSGYCLITGTNDTGVKVHHAVGGVDGATGSICYFVGGYWNNAATVTSVSFLSEFGNFDAGTLYIYGA